MKPEHAVLGHFSQTTIEIIVLLNTYPKGLKCLYELNVLILTRVEMS